MKIHGITALSLCVLSAAGTARAQNETFTQVGSFQCAVTYGGPTPWTCPNVTFPREFGAAPDVILSISSFAPAFVKVQLNPNSVTARGFSTFISVEGGRTEPVKVSWVAVGPVLLNGTALPNYLVLTVIYAPPGTNGGHSTSSVSYQAGSTTGTTISASQSFQVANSISLEAKLGDFAGAGISFDWSRSTTDSQSLDIKKSTTSSITQTGAAQDGVNHDEDEIWLLLKPTVSLALSSSSAAWIFANTPSQVQYVHVGWLNGHEPMPTGVAGALQKAGITSQDYPDILARDPFANSSYVPDLQRFIPINTTFPYEPPLLPNDPVPTVTFNVSDSSAVTVGSGTEETYKVGAFISGTASFLDFVKLTLKDAASWDWTNKSSQATTTGTSQSATVTVGGPAYGYSGANTAVQVYYDTLYKTFAFAIVPISTQEIAVYGQLVTAAGAALPMTEVTLVEKGVKHHTFTNAKGQYRFFGHITGPASIQAAGVTQQVPQAEPTMRHVDIRKP